MFSSQSRWVATPAREASWILLGPVRVSGAGSSLPVEIEIVKLVLDGVDWRDQDAIALIVKPGGDEV